jgi:hypothetical protein
LNDRVTLFGEVVAVDGEDAQVRLDSDELALLHDAGEQSLDIGYRGEFVVEGRSPEGRTVVSPLRRANSAGDATAFDLEFDRLQTALSGRRTGTRSRASEGASQPIEEDQIRGWIHRIDGVLSQLRKHRAKRLSEQVSDES